MIFRRENNLGKIIKFKKKSIARKNDNEYLEQLYYQISEITGNAEITETEDGDCILDAVSEMKIAELESKIKRELLKMGYSMQEVYNG